MTLVAIDGPAGAGKSTVARAVAARLGLERLDTGAMYRAVTLLVLREGADPSDAGAAARLAREMSLVVDGDEVRLAGEDVTLAIRALDVDAAVSAVAAHAAVREELVARQRAWAAAHGGGVVEGRDIGSVVFPSADLKVYLTADEAERARRRREQDGRAGAPDPGAVQAVQAELARRDGLDAGRAVSPLLVADGAVVVDSTGKTIEEVVDEVVSGL